MRGGIKILSSKSRHYKRFFLDGRVWAGGYKDYFVSKTDCNRLVRWMEVKISKLEGVGLGLFAARKFFGGDVITVYLGRKAEKDIDSVYSTTNQNVVLDCKPFEDGDTLLGGHLANDHNWSRKEGVLNPQSQLVTICMV